MFHANRNDTKMGTAIPVRVKTDFETKAIKKAHKNRVKKKYII